MKVYLAARYSRKKEIKALVPLLLEHGIQTTSRWLDETGSDTAHLNEFTPAFCRETAHIDLADIEEADSFVFFAEDPTVGTPRGGRHVEFGYALAKGKEIHVIGDYENIFHFLPNIRSHRSVDDFLEAVL